MIWEADKSPFKTIWQIVPGSDYTPKHRIRQGGHDSVHKSGCGKSHQIGNEKCASIDSSGHFPGDARDDKPLKILVAQ